MSTSPIIGNGNLTKKVCFNLYIAIRVYAFL